MGYVATNPKLTGVNCYSRGSLVVPAPEVSLLYSNYFDSAQDVADPEGSGGSADRALMSGERTTLVTNEIGGSWDGSNCLKIQTVDSINEGDGGINLAIASNAEVKDDFYVSWIAKYGSSWKSVHSATPKMAMTRMGPDNTNDDDSGSGDNPQMIESNNSTGEWVPQLSQSSGNLGRADQFGNEYASDFTGHTFRFDVEGLEWCQYIIRHNVNAVGGYTLTVKSRDGTVWTDLISIDSATALINNRLKRFRFAAYLYVISGSDANSNILLDRVEISDSAIALPDGFVV